MPLKKSSIDFNALGALIMATIIPTFGLESEDEELVNGELLWLFSAADNLIKVILREADRSRPVAVPIPPEAEKSPEANNQLLKTPKDSRYSEREGYEVMLRGESSVVKGGWHRDIDSIHKQMNTYLTNLDILLKQEAGLGEAGKSDVALQAQISASRTSIVKDLQALAKLMNNAYGILVTSPGQLVELLAE